MNQSQVSRRNFLKGAGMLTGAAALAAMTGCAPNGGEAAATVTSENIEWDHEADVIVCGGGGGLLAACDAADAGSSVILLEKAASVGGESSVNEAWINGSGTSVQKAEGVQDDAQTEAADYAANHAAHINNIDQELLADYCANSGAAIERLIELGCEYKLAQDTMFYTTVPRAHLLQPNASAWGSTLGKAAEDRGVEIMTSTPLTELVVNEAGEVVGVKLKGQGLQSQEGGHPGDGRRFGQRAHEVEVSARLGLHRRLHTHQYGRRPVCRPVGGRSSRPTSSQPSVPASCSSRGAAWWCITKCSRGSSS